MNKPQRFKAIPAAYVLFEDKGKILILLRANTGYYDGYWGLPSGHVEQGESLKTAALREALEETGILLKKSSLDMVHVINRPAKESLGETRLDFFFATSIWTGTPKNTEPYKCAELKWVNKHKLPDNMIPEVRQALEAINAGIVESEFDWDRPKAEA